MKQRIRELCELPGVSGRENAVREYIVHALQQSAVQKEITVDRLGNVICRLKGEREADKTLLISAHMDEIGLIITHITDGGFLRFATVGGIRDAALLGKRVKIGDVVGVIGCKAVHLCSSDEKKTVPKAENMLIDIGASTANEAEQLVAVGDVAVFDADFCDMQDLVVSKALDDRFGCAVLLKIAEKTPLFDMTLAFTVQEEVGLRGAGPVAFAVNPDIAIVVETTTASDIPDVSVAKQVCQVGRGPVVSFMDKRTLYDAELYKRIRALADRCGIPNQTKTVIAGGNDAGSIQVAGNGVRVSAISVPCRYLHSSACVLSMKDVEWTYQLLEKTIEDLLK